MIETKRTPAGNQVSGIEKSVCLCLQGLEHSVYCRNKSGVLGDSISEILWKYCYSKEFQLDKRKSENPEPRLISIKFPYNLIEITLHQ